MTTLVKTEILGVDFDLDECADIATHGCSAGVSGFIHTVDNIEAYDEYEYTIMDSLDEWADELGATNGMEMILDSLNRRDITPTIDTIKECAVWMYVEKCAWEFCIEEGHEDFV
tara:strand:+ start:599 stop:940 length:342 start_codon:yes stop_codon:yes gene_type:complete